MEVASDLSQVFNQPEDMERNPQAASNPNVLRVDRIDQQRFRWITPRKHPHLVKAIDTLGEQSAKQQGLRRTLTTYDKIMDSEQDGNIYYLVWQRIDEHASKIFGYLKTGHRRLYLRDEKQKLYICSPLSILDFYTIHQRQGYGKRLFDAMLEDEHEECVDKLAFDKPTTQLLSFMKKHFALEDVVWQTTNFAVFASFFIACRPADEEGGGAKDGEDYCGTRRGSKMQSQQHSPRMTRDRPPSGAAMQDRAGGIIHGTEPLPSAREASADSAKGRKNARDFGHSHIFG